MENFLLLIREDIEILRSAVERNRRSREMINWVETLGESGNFFGGEPLAAIGRYISKDAVLSDGPFIEAKECISGYISLKAENLEQAVSISQTCPYVLNGTMILEVRPVLVNNE